MNDRQIECFLKLVETKSFSKTAEALYITQPNVSHHIRTIEKDLNVELIKRTTTSFELTAAGKAFYSHCLKIMEALEETRIDMLKYQEKKEIRIGFPSLLLTYNIDRFNMIMDMLNTKYPDYTFIPKIVEGVDKTTALDSDDVDIVICKVVNTMKKKYDYDILFKQQAYVMVGVNHPLSSKDVLTVQDIESYVLYLISSDTSFNLDIKSMVSKTQKVVFYPTYESVNTIIRENKGIAINYQNKAIEGIKHIPLNLFDDYLIACVYNHENNSMMKEVSKIIQEVHRL